LLVVLPLDAWLHMEMPSNYFQAPHLPKEIRCRK
jgi:hypothetical protein